MEGRRTSQSTHASLNSEAPPPFLSKTYDMVEDPSTDRIVSWGPGDNSFVVWNPPEFATNLLPKYFKHNNFSSFVRQLNTYGFRKIDPDRWEFANEGFLRGQKHLLKRINRRKYSHVHNHQQQHQAQSSSVGACVEVGKFGVEEEIEGLKRDKNVLMQELVRLRQQQQASDHQLQILGQRLQRMEQHQQQMMSFLAKAMQSPGYLAQLVQQNDSSRRIAGVKKKRRLQKQEDDLNGNRDPTGQIIKYQPLINEAAKAMLKQILKMDLSPRMEASDTPDGFLIDNVPSSPEPANTESSWSQISGVTLDEAPTSTSLSNLMVSSGFPSSDAAMSEIQSSATMSNMVTPAPSLSDVISSNFGEQETLTPNPSIMSVPDFPQLQRVPEGNVLDIPCESFVVHGTDSKLTNSMEMGVDRTMPIEPDEFSGVAEMDNIFDGLENDVSWEQLILPGLISEDACECESNTNSTGGIKSQPWQENGWSNAQRLEHLTEQLGLLTSESEG